MYRPVKLEYLKLKSNRALWILLGLYVLCICLVAFSGRFVLQYLADQGVEYRGIDPTILPIYAFDDIWQNLAFLGGFFKIFPAFLLVISISNEYGFKTHRQNIIDGLSRWEFLVSKLSFAAFLAVLSGILLLILGMIMGVLYSDVYQAGLIFKNFLFIPAHIYQLFLYFIFCIFLALLIRKSGITIVLILLYSWFLEPIAEGILTYFYGSLAEFLPLASISAIVRFPFTKYILLHTRDYISLADVAVATAWGILFGYGIYYQLKKRDF